ncbi:DUF2079 domain-containing protein [Actinoallomurus sp. CA-150999]|uniref:DUF2079 domain-containing protein n=1 Tax=Actinoallomurus sp. CA-150999 TaxID=3239887 RepID=UPI003D90D783
MSSPRLLSCLLFAAYSALSVNRHRQMRSTGYDLGIFEQAVRSYAHLRPPIADLKGPGFNLLGDHFHPILVLAAPFYRMFPSPVTLLVLQAALLALSAVPVTRLAIDFCGHRAGVCLGLAYGLSWGIQQAVVFDFHEIAFAVPLLARSVELLARRRWSAAAGWALPLLLVKEDQAFIVAAIGVYIFRQGHRRLGALVTAAAVAVGALAVLVIIPAFNPHHSYPYDKTAGSISSLPVPVTKEETILALLAPTLFFALRSPLVLLAVPSLLARFWTSNPMLWGSRFHYNAVLMPIIFIAFADGLARMRASGRVAALRGARVAPILALIIAMCVPQPLWRVLDPASWRVPEQVRAAEALLRIIPDEADVAAANRIAPQLTGRCRVFRFLSEPTPQFRPEWVATTGAPYEQSMIADLPSLGYSVVARAAGITIYRRTRTVLRDSGRLRRGAG